MPLYKVTWDDYDWDEYTGFVVRANSFDEALEMCKAKQPNMRDIKVSLVFEDGPPEIIMEDFNAG